MAMPFLWKESEFFLIELMRIYKKMHKDAITLLLDVILSLLGAPWFQAGQLSPRRLSPQPPGLMGSHKFTAVVGKASSTRDCNKNLGDGFTLGQLLALCGRYEAGIHDHTLCHISDSSVT